MGQLTTIVKNLLIINVLMYIGTHLLLGEPNYSRLNELFQSGDITLWDWKRNWLALFYPSSDFFRPFQLVTHMFMHGSMMHLFFNMFALAVFGPHLERILGEKKFFFFYFFTGFGALALHLFVTYLELQSGSVGSSAVNVPMMGASGAVFGLLAGFGMKFPNQMLQLIFPPVALKAKYMVLIYGGLELFLGLNNFQEGVAHFAHVGGAVFGAAIIWYWDRSKRR